MPKRRIYGPVRGIFSHNVILPAGTGSVEVVTDFVPGFEFKIESVKAYTAVAGTGTSASRVFRVVKGASTVVATATLLLADTDTVGKEKAFTVTAANANFTDADTLTIDFPSAGAVAFTAGQVNLIITYFTYPQKQ